jgi:hypothetical protein
MYQPFISKYCKIPVKFGPEIIPVSEQEVIDHFTKYVEENCKQEINVVQYYMPNEFKARIKKEEFWRYICSFLSYQMEFEMYDTGYGKMDEIWDYEKMDFKTYYTIYEKINPHYPEYTNQFICNDITKITKVVFRIYNPSIDI